MKKLAINTLSILILVLFTSSCGPGKSVDMDKAIRLFFLGLTQLGNIIVFGTASVSLCIISGYSAKTIFKVLGGVFLGLFSICAVIGYIELQELHPEHGKIHYLFLLEAVMIIVSFVFVFKKPKTAAHSDPFKINETSEIR